MYGAWFVMSRLVFHESRIGVAMVVRLSLLPCLIVYAEVMWELLALCSCSVHFVFGSMLYVWCCLYEVYSAELGCIYLWILGLSKRVKSLLGVHAGCDHIF